MDLIPERGEVIVDPLRLLDVEPPIRTPTEPAHGEKTETRTNVKEMEVVVLPQTQTKRVISIPRVPKFKVLSVVRGDIRAMGYRFSSAGRYSELWVHDNMSRISVVRRSDKKTLTFGQDAFAGITNYLAEIQRRGVSLTQATDIICNGLCQ
jgi:hypothetical protein